MRLAFPPLKIVVAVLALALAVWPAAANAQGSMPGSVHHLAPADAARFSRQIEDDLTRRGATVALVFRSGRPRKTLPSGLAYTHGAFWVSRAATAKAGQPRDGYVVYNLYQGDGKTRPKDRSALVQDLPFDFAAGSAEDDVAVIIPTPDMQQKILKVINSPTYSRLHNPSYSLIANPFQLKHQNCNGFLLSVVSAAAWGMTDEGQIVARLRTVFKPSVVQVDALKRLVGPYVDKGVKTDDQPKTMITAAYEFLAVFMKDNKLAEAVYDVRRRP